MSSRGTTESPSKYDPCDVRLRRYDSNGSVRLRSDLDPSAAATTLMRALTKIPAWLIAGAIAAVALVIAGATSLKERPQSQPRKRNTRRRSSGAPRRKVFFSFHYQRDIWRVNQVRNADVVDASAAAGWSDASLWEEAKKKGDAAIKQLIDDGLEGTTVTAVLIGKATANRKYVNYEIEQSLRRGNGLLGIRIHALTDQDGRIDEPGEIPEALRRAKLAVYDWDRQQFGSWVQKAYRRATRRRVAGRGTA